MRDYEWLRALSTFTRSRGVLIAPLQSVAKVLGYDDRKTVYRAVESLEEIGALTIRGRLDTRRDWFSRQYEWEEWGGFKR